MKTIKAKVHRLPTEKGLIYRYKPDGKLYYNTFFPDREVPQGQNTEPHHLYITTDEEIKEGDWFYNKGMRTVDKASYVESSPYIKNTGKKIIATTDSNLLTEEGRYAKMDKYKSLAFKADRLPSNYTLPQIPQSFIEEYCKAGGIDEVLVELESIQEIHVDGVIKQGVKLNPDNTIIIHPVEERVYSREEVEGKLLQGFKAMLDYYLKNGTIGDFNGIKWIEKNL